MTAELLIGLGLGVWALSSLLLVSAGGGRRRAMQSLSELGLTVVDDSPLNPQTMTGPRKIAEGTYRGLALVLEDFVAHRPDGSAWPHTRVRAQTTHRIPAFVLSAHDFDAAEKTEPTHMRALALGEPLDGRMAAAVQDAHGETLLRALATQSALLAVATTRGRGQVQEITARNGELEVVLAGMSLAAPQLRAALDTLVLVLEHTAATADD
ncbi:MAG: hypothetical protein JKY37_11020 [Nannocystaceae bacterium]|nr:hypothetical protein [Nannocystaceae bacterium]